MAVISGVHSKARQGCCRRAIAVLGLLALGGCGGDGEPPAPQPTPPRLSLEVAGDVQAEEALNPKVTVTVRLDASASGAVAVALNLGGTARHGLDYAITLGGEEAEVSNSGVIEDISISPGARSASLEIDIYRDFENEGDETIDVSLGTITGNAGAGETPSVTLTVLDGESAVLVKGPPEDNSEEELELIPLGFNVTDSAFVATVLADLPSDASSAERLVAEWSTDRNFTSDVNTFTDCYAPSTDTQGRLMSPCQVERVDDPLEGFFANIREFRLPMAGLAPNQQYFLRIWLAMPPEDFESGLVSANVVTNSFATNAEGRIALRCEPPERTPAPGSGDPLFAEQWHLVNTGQMAFSDSAGTAGADMHMMATISAGRTGAGVKLAVVDTGLEICHPDLAANTSGGGSFNFAAAMRTGASADDPYNFSSIGDHGTSVAGVAGAAANNGLGGRGVAPEVRLVGFNPLEAQPAEGEDSETIQDIAMIKSLGGSSSAPDSASVDIFNMSFGAIMASGNSFHEFAQVIRMGTEQLRSGRGAIYVKASGNEFSACDQEHPFHRELGCISGNSDPDNNLPWLMVVGGFNADDRKSSYSNAGANLWIVAPSGEDGIEAPAMITTDQAGPHGGYSQFPDNRLTSEHPLNRDGDYMNAFGGTSAATPAAAGAVALMLGVKPELTWRDVKHILARTARRIDPDITEVRAAFNGTPYVAQYGWQTNGAGYTFHNWYGFGAIHVDDALMAVDSYTPDSLGTLVESPWFEGMVGQPPATIPDADGVGVRAALEVSGVPEGANIEAVVLEISVKHDNALDLGITLGSPSGTQSVLNPPFNQVLDGFPGLSEWRLLSNAFYGENPNGEWALHLVDLAPADTGTLSGWRLRFYYGEHTTH